jgi:sulfide:quinone oxidoreductase
MMWCWSVSGNERRVVILGGGAGGYVAAKKLAAIAKESKANIKVTLITDTEWHYFHPLYVDVPLAV